MNNSLMQVEEEVQESVHPHLRSREEEITRVLAAISALESSEHWNILEQILKRKLDTLRKDLIKEKDTTEMFRLQGKISWAEQYELAKLKQSYRNELEGIKHQLLHAEEEN